MSVSRAKGTRWETALVDYLRQFWPHVERRTLSGSRDKGDIAGIPGVCVEAKAARVIELAAWLDEVKAETVNARAEVGMVWMHRRGKASPADGYVLMDGRTAVHLLKAAGW